MMDGDFSSGQYIRIIRTNLPVGAGSEFVSLSGPGGLGVECPTVYMLDRFIDLRLEQNPIKADLWDTLHKICIKLARIKILARDKPDPCKFREFRCICRRRRVRLHQFCQ